MGKLLYELRIGRGLSEQNVAETLGITARRLREYEDDPGKLPVSLACELLNLYSVDVDEITFR